MPFYTVHVTGERNVYQSFYAYVEVEAKSEEEAKAGVKLLASRDCLPWHQEYGDLDMEATIQLSEIEILGTMD